jgi:menaquinone-specific isochorismate synthase
VPSFRNSAERSRAPSPRGLQSVCWPLDPARIPALIQALQPEAIFEDPHGERLYGVGACVVLEASAGPFALVEQARTILESVEVNGEAPRFLGGFAFDPGRTGGGDWLGFPAGRLVMPELLVSDRGHAIATLERGDTARLDALHRLLESKPVADAGLPRCLHVQAGRSRASWGQAIAAALGSIDAGVLEKVVLARPLELTLDRPLQSARLIESLGQLHPGCYRFAFRVGTKLFAGATPELLFRREGTRLQTMALAGTARRDPDPIQDQALGAALLTDDKERREHALVTDALREALAPLASSVQVDGPSLRRLANLQHLETTVRAQLERKVSDGTLLERLHPTPAVCGAPREKAKVLLQELEGFDRGWYAGPVGVISREGATFAVALRCLLAESTRAQLFVGAGIVAGSEADREWQETETKSLAVLRALGHDRAP